MFDAVILAKNIYTMNAAYPTGTWVALKGDKIAAVGTGAAPEAETTYDFGENTIIPGLIDPHVHGTVAALFEQGVDLSGRGSIDDILSLLKEKVKTDVKAIVGHSLMVPFLKEARWPNREELDLASAELPIVIVGYDMHGSVLNTAALKSIVIDETDIGVEKKDGELTGRMVSDDAHFSAISQILGGPDFEHLIPASVDHYVQKCFSFGITGIHALEGQFVADNKDIDAWLNVAQASPLHVVVYPQVWDMDSVAKYNFPRHGGCITLDGSNMNYTMAMNEPYTDLPSTRGFLMRTDAEVYQLVSRAHAENKQCAFHALGERAIDQILNIYDQVQQEQGFKDLRHRIEHFTCATDEQIAYAAKLGCVVVPQPELSPFFDDPSVIAQFGQERADNMERYADWTKAGLVVCGSSDAPINGLNPLPSIHALVNSSHDSRRLDVETALKYYTINPAYAAHEEHERGQIAEGFFASFTVLDRDPFAEPEDIENFRVTATIADGTLVYRA